MFIVWGYRKFVKKMGLSNIVCHCPNCKNKVRLEIKNIGRKFTMFWIPLFTTRSEYYLVCPVCNIGRKITKQEAEEV